MKNKIEDILNYLDELYENPRCELEYQKDYELLIATVLSATLSICYGFIMSLFIFLMNLLFPRILGYFYSMLLHIVNYMLIFIFTSNKFVKYSLLGNNMLTYHNFEGNNIGKYALSISQSYLLNIVVVTILIFLIIKATYRYDFKTVVGV